MSADNGQIVSVTMLESPEQRTTKLIVAGKFGEAISSATEWVSRENSSEAFFALALCHSRMGEPHRAIGHLESALEINETHRDAATLLALSLFQMRKMNDARKCLHRVHQMDGPLSIPSLQAVVELSAKFKNFDQAREYAEQLVTRRPEVSAFWPPLANFYHYLHRVEDAERACQRALALDPNNYLACYTLSQLRRATPEKNNIVRYMTAFANTSASRRARYYLGGALAKEHEDLGEYDEAFRRLDAAMADRYEDLDAHQVESTLQLAKDVATAFLTVDRNAATGFPSKRPIFIIGMPRSGTTLLEQILATGDDICVAGELDDFDITLWNQIDPERTAPDLNQAVFENAAAMDFERLGADYLASVEIQIGGSGSRFFIDKKPYNFFNAGYIALALPQARILSMKRDPMDTCFANFKQAFAKGALYSYRQEDTARYFLAYQGLMEFWEEQFPGRIFEVNYEDLVSNPEETSRRVFDHLGLAWSPECLSFHKNPQASGSASSGQVRHPVYTSSVGRWKHFESHLGPMRRVLNGD